MSSISESISKMAFGLGSLDLNKGLSIVSQSVSQVSNTVNINIESVLSGQPRGLSLFISEIRACKTKEQERVRVDAELGNIRQKFSNVANLSSYQKKKYVWKMCYIHMLGYEVDFGHLEFISLMASTKYSEKSVGYMAISLMLKPGDELMTLVINSMRNDIVGNMHGGQCLGLAAVSNIGGADLAEALASDVQRLIVASDDSRGQHHHHPGGAGPGSAANFFEAELTQKTMLCKKASLCLLRLFRTNPDIVMLDSWMQRLGKLLEDRDLGVVTSLMSLLLGFASTSPQTFEPLVPYVISILTRLVVNKTCSHEYLYYRLPCPWLQVKCLRFLQYYKIPEAAQFELLNDILSKILVRTEHSGVGQSAGTESNNRTNAEHAILFEAINLILTFGLDAPTFLKEHTSAILGRFIGLKDANTRYLGLDAMIRLAKIDGPATVQMHQQTVMDSLKDADISVRRKALGLLYVLADESNAQDIVGELVLNLSSAEAAIKEDMVVKIAIMAEKYSLSVEDDKQSASVRWYVDIMVQVLMLAGDYVAEAVWYRVVQVVTNTPDIHEYAAEKLLGTVQSKWAHETLVAVSGYLLGEIGVTICEKPGMSGLDQLTALSQHLSSVPDKVKGILLTCVVKLLNLYPEQTAAAAWELLKKFSTSSTLELQQRACEYIILAAAHLRSVRGDDSLTGTRLGQGVTPESASQLWSQVNATTLESVLNPMPVYFLNNSESVLLSIASGVAAEQAVTDRSVWSIEQGEKDASRDAYKQTKEIASQEQQSTFKEPAAASLPPKPTKVPIQIPKPVTVDLLSMDDSPPPPPSAPATSSTFAAENAVGSTSLSSSPSLASLFTTASLLGKQGKGKGLTLVENSELRVTLSNFDIRGHRARIVLAVRAKKAGGLTEVSLRGYSQSPESLIIKSAPSPVFTGLVSEGSEVECLQIAAECMRPFSETQSPLVDLSARSVATGQTVLLEKVRLPLSVCSFCEPLPCDKETYMTRWRSIEGAGTESQEIFSVSGDVEHIRSLLVSGCGLGLAEGLDNDRTVTGCASFTTGTVGPNGVSVSVGVMMRLEVDPTQGKSRVTVRAKNPIVTQAFKAFVVEALSV